MGTKDNPQKPNLLLHGVLAVTIAAGSVGGYLAYDKINELDAIVEKQEGTINAQQKKLEEQGSLINQQKKKIQSLEGENDRLNETIDGLETQISEKDAVIKEQHNKVADLEKESLRLRSVTTSSMPSRGSSSTSKEVYMEATGYTAFCSEGCTGVTATGINLAKNRHAKVVAVDPRVIPLGTKVYVEGYGYAIAGDTGGAIKGHKLDLHFATNAEARSWGRRTVKVRILN